MEWNVIAGTAGGPGPAAVARRGGDGIMMMIMMMAVQAETQARPGSWTACQ